MDPSGGMSNNYFTATQSFIHWASGCSYNVPARQDLLLLLFLFWLLYGEAIAKVAIVAAAAAAASAASAVNVADEIGINLPAEIVIQLAVTTITKTTTKLQKIKK
uniref:Uncharacterized protein n=1 Tax=Glossina pallidipes TaxID=7398 RepID=A0A1A9ZTW4_GLOPL